MVQMVTQLYDTQSTGAVQRPGFWRRAAAYIIDSALIALAWLAVVIALSVVSLALVEDTLVYDGTILALGFWVLFGLFAAWFAYEWIFNARGTSGGKALFGITVVDATGAPPGAGAGCLRTLGMIVGVIPLGLGYWWAIWDREDRAWHDMMAHTSVVRRGYMPYLERGPEPTETAAERSSQRISSAPRAAIATRSTRPASSVRSRLNLKQNGANASRALSVRATLARRRR